MKCANTMLSVVPILIFNTSNQSGPIGPIGHRVYWIESDFDVGGDCSICLWIGWTESGTASPLVWNRLVVSMYLDTNW